MKNEKIAMKNITASVNTMIVTFKSFLFARRNIGIKRIYLNCKPIDLVSSFKLNIKEAKL